MFSIFIGIRIINSWNDCNFEFSEKFKKNIVLIGTVTTIVFAVPSFKDEIDLLNSQTDITLLSKIYNLYERYKENRRYHLFTCVYDNVPLKMIRRKMTL